MKLFYTIFTGICILTFTLLVAQKSNSFFKFLSFTAVADEVPVNKKVKAQPNKTGGRNERKNVAFNNTKYSATNLFGTDQQFFAVGITATKTVDKATAVPGDVLNYTITVTNNSGTSATNVVLTDAIDANTTLVAGSVTTSPIAGDDAYASTGNVGINVPAANGILANDNLGTPTPAVFVAITNGTTTQSGNINIAADGSFTYVPAPGFTGTDTYVYTLTSSGGSSSGTITFTVSGMVWFIKNDYSGGTADGRLNTPFKTLSAFNTVNLGGTGQPKAGDAIFVYTGSALYTGGVTLLANQKLVGQGASASLSTITSIFPPTYSYSFPATGGTYPNLVNSTGFAVKIHSGNTVRGFNCGVLASSTLSGITSTAGTNFTTLDLQDMPSIYATGQALSLTSGTITSTTLPSVTSLGGTNNILLSSVAGGLTITAGALSGASAASISNSTCSATVSYGCSIANSNSGISLINNTGGTFNFTGGLSLSATGSNSAFTATGGGTLNITQNNTTIVNTLTSSTGNALNVASGTQIGSSGLTFRSIAANGAAKGVILNNTGSNGGFVVTGNGSSGTGGIIQNVTGRGMELISVKSVSLTYMNFTQSTNQSNGGTAATCGQNDVTGCNAGIYLQTITGGTTLSNLNITGGWQEGINGTTLTNLVLNACTLTSNGNESEEGGIKLRDITGTSCAITNCNVTLSGSKMAHIINTTGTMRLAVSGSTFSDNLASGFGENAFELRAQGSANNTVVISNSTFSKAYTKGIQMFSEGTTSLINASIKNCTIDRVVAANDMAGVETGADQTGTMNVNVDNNNLISSKNEIGVNLYSATTSTFQGTVINNTSIKGSNDNSTFATVRAVAIDNAISKVQISGNNISETDQQAILVHGFKGTLSSPKAKLDATVTGNTINEPNNSTSSSTEAIEIRAGSGLPSSTSTVCSNVSSNSVTLLNPVGRAFRVRTSEAGTTINLQGSSSGGSTPVINLWNNNSNTLTNSAASPSPIISSTFGGSTINYGVTCTAPSNIGAVLKVIPVDEVKDKGSKPTVSNNVAAKVIEETVPASTEADTNLPVSAEKFTVNAARTASGETVTTTAFTLPASKSVTIKFQVTVNTPFPTNTCSVSNQGTVTGTLSGSNFSVLTDNPSVGGLTDPTVTAINIAPSITACQPNIVTNPDANSCTASKTFGVTYTGCPAATVTYTLHGTATTITSPYSFPTGTTTVDVSVSNGIGSAATCSFTVTVNTGSWLGTTSTDWNTGANWCGGIVPTSASNVLIPTGAVRMPVLTTASVANNITLEASTTLSLNGQTLTVSGDVSGSGLLIGSTTSSLTLAGTGTTSLNFSQTTDGTTNALANLTLSGIGSTNTLNNKLNIFNTVTLSGGNLATGGTLVLKSNASGTARIANISSGSITGTITIERYIPGGRRAYRYIAHPFNGALGLSSLTDNIDITGTGGSSNGFTTTTSNNPSAYHYEPTLATAGDINTGWQAFTSTNGAGNNAWKQYQGIAVVVRGAKGQGLDGQSYTPTAATLDMTGAVNQGTQVVQLTKGTNSNFNLVGNPYPSNINLNLATRGSGIGSAFYVWDPTMAMAGAYTTVSYGAGVYVLPSSASFFTEATSGTAANNTITFHEADKVSTAATSQLFRTVSTNQLQLQLETGAITWDRLQYYFDDSYVATKAPGDATKLNNPEVNLYSLTTDSKPLAIDFRPVTAATVLPLGLTTDAPRTYTLRVTQYDIPAGLIVFIKDKYLNQQTALTAGGTYSFAVTADAATQGEGRFELLFSPGVALPVTMTSVKAYPKAAGVQVEWTVQQESNMDSYEVERSANGQSFTKTGTQKANNGGNNTTQQNYSYFDPTPLKGTSYYRIYSVDKNGQATNSAIVKVTITGSNTTNAAAPQVTVTPNPVEGNTVTVQFTNLTKGRYTIVLSNKLGQQIASKVIDHQGGSSTEVLEVQALASGLYQLKVTGNGTTVTRQVVKK